VRGETTTVKAFEKRDKKENVKRALDENTMKKKKGQISVEKFG